MSAKQTDTMEYVGDLKFWTRCGHPLGYHRGLAPKKKPRRSGARFYEGIS
jgi:hypothetical protein